IKSQHESGKEGESKMSISKEEEQQVYDQHKSDMEQPERIKLSEILVSTEKKNANDTSTEEQRIAAAQTKADDLLAQIRKGAKFEDIAKKYSDGPSAAQGGDRGYFNRA